MLCDGVMLLRLALRWIVAKFAVVVQHAHTCAAHADACEWQPTKCYPREFMNPGRVRVQIKDGKGAPLCQQVGASFALRAIRAKAGVILSFFFLSSFGRFGAVRRLFSFCFLLSSHRRSPLLLSIVANDSTNPHDDAGCVAEGALAFYGKEHSEPQDPTILAARQKEIKSSVYYHILENTCIQLQWGKGDQGGGETGCERSRVPSSHLQETAAPSAT